MRLLRDLDLLALVAWISLDTLIVLSRRRRDARRADRLSGLGISLLNWTAIVAAVSIAQRGIGVPRWGAELLQLEGLALFAAGVALRAAAIVQLGPFHMPTVAIRPDHRLVDTGLYRRIRHPSYLGAIAGFLGFALGLGSWASVVPVLGLSVPAYLYRIQVEERALLEALGQPYADYCRRTHRLIPGVY
ncbi:MAG TPA: isoprenylcysteine carboxylmethyltransferase family protein [Candidatus Saccharimonadales bacterium]|nr:isoprenylcysteine carboxylmethyltransferase family protein [Candidatus Saccharimonadales bacterium]